MILFIRSKSYGLDERSYAFALKRPIESHALALEMHQALNEIGFVCRGHAHILKIWLILSACFIPRRR
jgi:hypothetical protein